MNSFDAPAQLLVALPTLNDPNFDHTVVFLLRYSIDGALGVVANRIGKTPIATLLPAWATLVCEPGRIMLGGPVQIDGLLGFAVTNDGVVNVDLGDPPGRDLIRVRIFAGYSGWGAGQLDEEIDEGSWLLVDAHPDDLWSPTPETLWDDVIVRQGGTTRWLALHPSDPSAN